MTLIAGSLDLVLVMDALAQKRPVFHSEADFQFAFAQVVGAMDSSIECRLEKPFVSARTGRKEYLDLWCSGPAGSTAIEFKYFTRRWNGVRNGEEFALRNQAAADLLRLHFIHDVVRLEHAPTGGLGLAVLLTNEPGLWSESTRHTRDREFHLHEGRALSGELRWAGGAYEPNTRVLQGSYVLGWRDYAELSADRGGKLRYLAMEVPAVGRFTN